MKLPKDMKRYCPFCRKHTVQQLVMVKKRKASELSDGQRRFRRKMAGYRGFPRPKPTSEKQTKKRDMRLVCSVCKKKHVFTKTFRAKKFEIKRA